MKEIDYWIWLSMLSILPYKKYQLISAYHSPEVIFRLDRQEILCSGILNQEELLELEKKKNPTLIMQYQDYMNKYGISLITYNDTIYPQVLRNIYDPPMVLYAKGNLQLLKQRSIPH